MGFYSLFVFCFLYGSLFGFLFGYLFESKRTKIVGNCKFTGTFGEVENLTVFSLRFPWEFTGTFGETENLTVIDAKIYGYI